MNEWLIPSLFTCGPLVFLLALWGWLVWKRKWPQPIGLVAFGIVTGNAAFAAYNFIYYQLRPTPQLPPWKDPQVLNFGLLFLLAPVGMIVGFIAGLRGTSWRLVWMLQIASLPLFGIGILAGMAV